MTRANNWPPSGANNCAPNSRMWRHGASTSAVYSGPYTTWNPSDKGPHIALSNGNLTMSSDTVGVYNIVRAITAFDPTKKQAFEFIVTGAPTNGGDYTLVGIATASASLTNFVGSDAYGYGYHGYNSGGNGNGLFWHSGASVPKSGSYTVGSVVTVQVNGPAKTMTVKIDGYVTGVNAYDISSVVGPFYAAATMYSSVNAVVANFGQSAFQHVDAGYEGIPL